MHSKERSASGVCEVIGSSCQHLHQATQVRRFCQVMSFTWNGKIKLKEWGGLRIKLDLS